jgi:hypothetical protein
MLEHIILSVSNVECSLAFNAAALKSLGNLAGLHYLPRLPHDC